MKYLLVAIYWAVLITSVYACAFLNHLNLVSSWWFPLTIFFSFLLSFALFIFTIFTTLCLIK